LIKSVPSERVHPANAAPVRAGGDYVLCWVQQALRSESNPLIEAALHEANALGKPLLVYHGLREDYPHASDRLHSFILGASRQMAQGLAQRGIACVQHVDRASSRHKGLVYQLAAQACSVFTDDNHAFFVRQQTERFTARCAVAVRWVDAARVVPTRSLGTQAMRTRDFRAAHGALRAGWFAGPVRSDVACAPYVGPLPFAPDRLADMTTQQLAALIASLRIDHSVPASAQHPPDRDEVNLRLAQVTAFVARLYAGVRNNPAVPFGTSMLSPYLHFGVVAPWEIVAAVESAGLTRSQSWKFLDELLTWREWSHHLAYCTPNLHRYETLPSRVRDSLEAHASDPRPDAQSLDDLINGSTSSHLWNAAQRQWLATGWMHNNLRMIWATQMLRFTASPRQAWALSCYCNDRFSLDGRDPATYASIGWAFGLTAAPRNAPIHGLAPRKDGRALMLRSGAPVWIEAAASAPTPRVAIAGWDDVLSHYAA
jgi:deoxyribodipyrimidine photo-lyase